MDESGNCRDSFSSITSLLEVVLLECQEEKDF